MMTPPPIAVASLGFENSLILMVLALVVFGPRRLPEIGRQIGRLMYEVRKASNDFKFQMEEELRKAEDDDRRKKEEARVAALALAAPAAVEISPVSEARPGAPAPAPTVEAAVTQLPEVASTPTAVESPYPGEGVYPEVSAGEFQHTEPYPLLQPPSTGEPIAAETPGRMSVPFETLKEEGSHSQTAEPEGPEFSEYRSPGASPAEIPAAETVLDTTPSSEVHHD
jgi:sec-independent protein translocase protein TatB